MLTGLVTSTFSSVVVSLGSRRIGRDALVDWMELGSIVLRGRAIRTRPGPAAVLSGLLVHQTADVFWAAVWGRCAGRLRRGRQRTTLALWLPWALATADYYLILPWLQPLVRMQVPYWTASLPMSRARTHGHNKREARRILTRHLSGVVYRRMIRDLKTAAARPLWPPERVRARHSQGAARHRTNVLDGDAPGTRPCDREDLTHRSLAL